MTRQHSSRGPGALLTLAALLLIGATPVASHAQASAATAIAASANAASAAVPAAGTAIRRASNVASHVSANVARAEAVTVPGDSSARPSTAAPVDGAAARPARTSTKRGSSDSSMLSFDREIYNYVADGRRDPFQSLMATGELRPLITDLRLVAVAYAAGGGSVAVLRDIGTNEQYRVRAGQQLGRMRVAAIQPKKVVFTIEEFGYSRQETLALGDLTNARTQQ